MSALLDVNVLLALAWPNHQFHAAVRAWFSRHAGEGWYTCAVTELGFVRLSSNPAFVREARTPLEAALLLRRMTIHPGHGFLAATGGCASAVFEELASRLLGHRQVTDAWLLHLARQHGHRLATFDRRLEYLAGAAGGVTVIEADG